MAVGKPLIIQIVGYQNSGKTTLLCKLVDMAVKEGWRVGTLKHHGHGGRPLLEGQGKDSYKHYAAGATVSAVEGEGTLQLTARVEAGNPEATLELYRQMEIDLILVEGYKGWKYPKVVLLRDQEDVRLLKELEQIVAIISKGNLVISESPYFLREDESNYLSWLGEYMRGHLHE
ncbi:molybdopterin-guanine dinucleotide biosynthesis protein B [Alkalicoccobacillus porphyridii]|uniref:Molybdopterin-guanine dinucleotide biosynthesis protein B n=1 Tax=Alkalicoccobacillus porphyridii TaxID=2597270 RepID=A0A553ZV45_9BACI|nr:molybdopterin-guanine dinucleotide biosynthesis protein B [Alkalicoccobacillus porphyridii]TSB45361.1 molybdopterin-guanine dinucleotide biosynthesis protein B [Alkalicoccobacillus porphyridii]